ncbi:MAG: hypothetical protein M1830_001833 [Pleopsidium flavum]|nr:MAG: hypothetical protein M1830_001833 [Pleopsidium flavum]
MSANFSMCLSSWPSGGLAVTLGKTPNLPSRVALRTNEPDVELVTVYGLLKRDISIGDMALALAAPGAPASANLCECLYGLYDRYENLTAP